MFIALEKLVLFCFLRRNTFNHAANAECQIAARQRQQ
jgi:hypothetical protein